MNAFEEAKKIFEQLHHQIADKNKDAKIAKNLDVLGNSYYRLTEEDAVIDYSDPISRLGYVFKYVGGHAEFLKEILEITEEEIGESPFSGPTLDMVCLGGGPGTDALAVKLFLDANPSRPPVTQLNCCVMDKEPGWEHELDVMSENLGGLVKHSFMNLDVGKKISKSATAELEYADLITISYLVSETMFVKPQKFFEDCFLAARRGAIIVYVDNFGEHTEFFDKLCDGASLETIVTSDEKEWNPTKRNVEARIFGSTRDRLLAAYVEAYGATKNGFNPKSSGRLGYRVMRKT
ncbi:MAG: hypothetical protein V4713_08785 [Pseudomonadota bacterium]